MIKLPDFVKDLAEKGTLLEDNPEESERFPPYIVNRWLSQNPNYLPLVNELQQYIGCLKPLQYFCLLKKVLPRRKEFHKYVKAAGGLEKEVFEWLARYWKVSTRMTRVYHRLLEPEQVVAILRKFGEPTVGLLKRMGVKEEKKKKGKKSLREWRT